MMFSLESMRTAGLIVIQRPSKSSPRGDKVWSGFSTITKGRTVMAIAVAKFLDVANGLQANQFSVGSRDKINSLNDIDPIYKRLLDEPIPVVLAVMGSDGRPNLTPMWFDYEGSTVLVNVASHRKKIEWIRANPQLSMLIVNPANMYHWVSIKCTVKREVSEDDPKEGKRVTAQLDKIWTKYTKNPPPYGLRDPSRNERRVLFECPVDRIATFGKP
jgi:PPOX class probable F420-dependent enzyme